MRPTTRSGRPGDYAIESWGNGFAYEIRRTKDDAAVFLQGDDAIRFGMELDRTTARYSDDDAASQFFD